MGGEGDLEAGVVEQEMQVSIEDVATLAIPEIVQEQLQASRDVGEAFAIDVDRIEVDLERNYFDDRKTRKCNSYSNAGRRKYK
jgi:hypothetical protein